MNALRREWGAVTFVVTILIGAVAVAISLGVSASHGDPSAVGASLPVVHAVRGHPDPGADRHAEAHGERQGDSDGDAHAGSDTGSDADSIQPTAPGLPDATAPADRGPDTDPQGHPDSGRRDPDAHPDADPGPHDPAELNAAADRDPDACLGLRPRPVRGRTAAGCRSRG